MRGTYVYDPNNVDGCSKSYYSGPTGKCSEFGQHECGDEDVNPMFPCCKWAGKLL